MNLSEKKKNLESILDGPINFLRASGLFTKMDWPRPNIKLIKSSKYKGLYAGIYHSNGYVMEIVKDHNAHVFIRTIAHEYFHHIQWVIGYANYLCDQMSRYNRENAAFIRGFEEAGASAFAAFYETSQITDSNKKASNIAYILGYEKRKSLEALEAIHNHKLQGYINMKMKEQKSRSETKQNLYLKFIGSAYVGRAIAMFAMKKNNFDFNKTIYYLMGDIYRILNDISATDVSVLRDTYKII